MTKKRVYLIIQSVLCVLLAVLVAASAVAIYRDGRARREQDPLESIYTAENISEKGRQIAPVFFGAMVLTAAGWILMKKEDAGKAVGDPKSSGDGTFPRGEAPGRQMPEEKNGAERIQRIRRGGNDLPPKAKRTLRIVLTLAAIVFIVLGVMNGSARAVFLKAAKICTECIGLG